MRPRVPPPLMMLMAAALMWVLHDWAPLGSCIPAAWTRLAVVPVLAGIAVAAAAVLRFRRAQTTVNPMDPGKASSLVTTGIFRVSRNPMYLGLTLLLVGWAIWLGTVSPWIVVPMFVITITTLQIIPEERVLENLFGEKYLEYKRGVGRWIGSFR